MLFKLYIRGERVIKDFEFVVTGIMLNFDIFIPNSFNGFAHLTF